MMKTRALLGAFALVGVIGFSACASDDQVEFDETAPLEEIAPPVEVTPDPVIVDSVLPEVDSTIVTDSVTL